MSIKQLSDGNPDGSSLGQAAADKISFYGATPIVQGSLPTALTTTPTTAELKAAVDGLRLIIANLGLAG
jgi:hypothetical protein